MESQDIDEAIFTFTLAQLQEESIRKIGRTLTEDELYYAKKGIECGLSFDIDTVVTSTIDEAVYLSKS